mgnify:CR=1 FL=1
MFGLTAVKEGVAGGLLLIAAWTDGSQKRISNRLIGLAWLIRALLFLWQRPLTGREAVLEGGRELLGSMILMGGLSLFAVLSTGGIGFGDVKLLGALSLYLGLWETLSLLLCGLLIAGTAALVLLAAGRIKRKSGLPLAPFLLTGYLLAILWKSC